MFFIQYKIFEMKKFDTDDFLLDYLILHQVLYLELRDVGGCRPRWVAQSRPLFVHLNYSHSIISYAIAILELLQY